MATKHNPKDLYEYKVSSKRIFIPKDVLEICDITGDFDVDQVTEINVEEGNPTFASLDGVLFDKSLTTLLAYPKARKGTYVIPHGTVNIDELSFIECLGLTSVEIPSSVKIIRKWTFKGCKSLQSVKMHEGLETIEEEAFSGCALQAAVVPKTVKRVEHEAFSCCPDITIYDSIDPTASLCCSKIDTINGSPNSEVGFIGIGSAWAMWDCAANHGLYDYVITVLSAQTGQVKYKVCMDMACSQRSYYCLLTSAWGRNATFCFQALDDFFPNIKRVDMKQRVAITRMKYPCDLTNEKSEMYVSYLLRSAKAVIRSCIDGNDMETLLFCEALGIIKKDNVSEMMEYAISRKKEVFSEYLQKYQLEKFGNSAVQTKTNTPGASERMASHKGADPFSPAELRKNWAFEKNADGTMTVTDYRGEETEITIPASIGDAVVTRIAAEALSPVKLHRRKERKAVLKEITQVTLPDSILDIGDKAFYGCVSLKKINLTKPPAILGMDVLTGCTKLYDRNSLLILNGYLYHSKAASKRTEITIPEGVHTILPYAFKAKSFYEKHFLATVTLGLPATLKKIASHAFLGSANFLQLDFPEGLEEIGESAFERCGVKDPRLVIPGSVRKVGNAAFQRCLLDEVWISEGVETIGDKCFDNNCVTLHLPASLKAIGSIVRPPTDWKNDPKGRISDLQVIYAPRGSAAEAYAGKYGFKFVEEAAAQPPVLRDPDYAGYCAQRFDQLLNRLNTPLSLSVNHGGLLQNIVFQAAESLGLIRQFYEEDGREVPRFVIDDTVCHLTEARLRELLAGAPRNADGQLSLGKMQFVVDAHDHGMVEASEPQIQLIAKNVSRDRVKVFWRIYQPDSYYKNKSHRFHVLGQEMGKEE